MGLFLAVAWVGCSSDIELDSREYTVTEGGVTLRYQMTQAVSVGGDEVDYTYRVALENAGLHTPGLRLSVSAENSGVVVPAKALTVGPVRRDTKTHAADSVLIQRAREDFFDPRSLRWAMTAPEEATSLALLSDDDLTSPLTDAEGPAFTAIGDYFLVRFQPKSNHLADDWTESAFDVEVEATGELALAIDVEVGQGESPGRVVAGRLSFPNVAMAATATTADELRIRSTRDALPRPDRFTVAFSPRFPESTSHVQTDCRYPALNLDYGRMGLELASTSSDVLLSAPHGRYDRNTLPIAQLLAENLPVNLVWAYDYRSSTWPIGHFANVNRPTGGFDAPDEDAERIYRVFRDCAHQVARRAYVEIHGNSRAENAHEIQVATPDGFSPSLAQAIKEAWPSVRGSFFADVDLVIEPVDRIYWTAEATKRIGMMRDCPALCLHFELPAAMRERDVLEETAGVLAALLSPFLH